MASPSLAPRLTLRAPADPQLAAELDRLERASLRVLQVFGTFGFASALLFAAISPTLGMVCAITAAVFTAWFFVAHVWLSSGKARRAFDRTATIMESAVAWTFFVVLALAEGPTFAVASWVPPMVFCAQIVAATVRLRPASAIVAGVLGGVAYPVLSVLLVGAELPDAGSRQLLVEAEVLLGRSMALLAAGVLGSLISAALLRAYTRAESARRAQDLFGKYRLLRPLASGGMGTVIEALYCPEGGFERRVAVKRVHPHLAELPEFVKAFRREAELSSRLGHPNIVQVMDFGRVGNSWFLAMEYVDGLTLHALLARAPGVALPAHVAGFIARELLSGLDHAHQGARGEDGMPLHVVHRDLCPTNVLLSASGEVKISDFGVARALGGSSVAHTRVTGHVGYVAPEQARGEPIDVRADLFPVGVMLWELLTGERLFERDNEAATLRALMWEDIPSVLGQQPTLDPGWDAVLARALQRDPEQRFPSARAMAAALETVPSSRGEGSRRLLAAMVRGPISDYALLSDPPPPSDAAPSVGGVRRS